MCALTYTLLAVKEYAKRFNWKDGEAYKLYKKYGTTLRGLQQEGYDLDVEDFLTACHSLPDAKLAERVQLDLRNLLAADVELRGDAGRRQKHGAELSCGEEGAGLTPFAIAAGLI